MNASKTHAQPGSPAAGPSPSPVGAPPAEDSLPPEVFPPEDRRLLESCLASTPGAWDGFVGRFAGLLAHVVDRTSAQRRVVLSVADRDDLIAEVLVELLRNDAAALRGFAGRSSLATYLAVIARRVAVRFLCRSNNAKLSVGQSSSGVQAADRLGDVRAVETDVADREEVELLLGRLDASEALLVRLHHLESRSYGEISRITGMPLGSIGPALSKARQRMRELAGDGRAAS